MRGRCGRACWGPQILSLQLSEYEPALLPTSALHVSSSPQCAVFPSDFPSTVSFHHTRTHHRHTFTRMHTQTHIYTHEHAHIHRHTNSHRDIHKHIHAHTHVHTHTLLMPCCCTALCALSFTPFLGLLFHGWVFQHKGNNTRKTDRERESGEESWRRARGRKLNHRRCMSLLKTGVTSTVPGVTGDSPQAGLWLHPYVQISGDMCA